jgi:pilus assembly protein TadC
MITPSWVAAISAGASVVVALLVAILGTTIRTTRRWAKLEGRMDAQERIFLDHVTTEQKAMQSLYDIMKDDRAATNRRFEWLEHGRPGP